MENKTTPKETIKNSEVPKDAKVIALILESMGVQEYEPRVIHQFLEFMYSSLIKRKNQFKESSFTNYFHFRICSGCITGC